MGTTKCVLIDSVLINCPLPCASMIGNSAAMPFNTPRMFTSIMVSHSSIKLLNGDSGITPALLKMTSTRPNCRMVHFNASLRHHLFQISVAQDIPTVSPHIEEDDVCLVRTPLKQRVTKILSRVGQPRVLLGGVSPQQTRIFMADL